MGGKARHIGSVSAVVFLNFLLVSPLLGQNEITNNTIGDFWHDFEGSEEFGYITWRTCPDHYLQATVDFFDIATSGPVQSIPGSEGAGAPRISESLVTWSQWVSETARDIFRCDLTEPGLPIYPVSDFNPGDDFEPVLSENIIAWVGEAPTEDYEIFYYDILTGQQVYFPNPGNPDLRPRIDYPYLVWYGSDGNDYEIAVFNIELFSGYQVTDNDFDDIEPEISGGMVTWWGYDGEDWEIFLHDALNPVFEVIQVTDNDWDDRSPVVESPMPGFARAAWYAFDGEDWEIWAAYDLPSLDSRQLSFNSTDDYDPRLSGENVVWYGWDGEDWEIFLCQGLTGEPAQMTHNSLWDQSPSIQDNRMVWERYDGEDYEICSAAFGVTGLQDPAAETLVSFGLGPWYPNPLESTSDISFSLPHSANVEISVYNLLGERVASLAAGYRPRGHHLLSWDGRDHAGHNVAAGVYICRLKADGKTSTRRLLVIR